MSSLNKSNYEDFDNSLGDHHDNLNSSIGTSSSSKAVLAALRALQDKIRRLETERSQALDDINSLKHQLKQQEIEHEATKQREQLISQKNLNDVKHAYDKLLNDKNDLELHLRKYEDKSKISLQHSDELQIKIRSLEEEKHHNQMKIKDLENQRNQIESQIKLAQIREEEMTQTLQWENKRHDENINFAHKRLQSLQDELQELSQEKGMNDAKLLELDGLVTQLLSVNESLVAQLTGKPITSKSHSNKKTNKKILIPKAATMSTIASNANRSNKYNAFSNPNIAIPFEVEHLKNMHNMYANIAKSIKKNGKKSKSSLLTKSSIDSNHSIDNSSGIISNKKNTRLSRKKSTNGISKYSTTEKSNPESIDYSYNASKLSSRSNTTTVPTSYSSDMNNKHAMDIRLPKPAVSFDNDYELSSSMNRLDLSGTIDHQQHQNDEYNYHNYKSNNHSLRSSHEYNNNNNSMNHTNKSNASNNPDHNEMQSVIESLEEEFDMLNNQYKKLLSNVQSNPTNVDHISPSTNISKDLPIISSENIQKQAEEIVNVIQQLHRKGEQIRALKSSP